MYYENYAVLRDARHMTDYQVAKETGLAASALYEWKSGRSTPKVDKLLKIAHLFHIPLEELVEGGD